MEMVYVVSGLVPLAGTVLFFVLRKRHPPKKSGPDLEFIQTSSFNLLKGMTFDEFRNPESFIQVVQRTAGEWLNGNSALIAVQLASLIESKGATLASFSPEVAQQIADGAAKLLNTSSGTQLTAVSKSGRILENARKVDFSTAARVAQVMPLIVGSAHIISGYDQAKRLAQVEKKLDKLIGYHKADQLAELKTIFEEVQKHWSNAKEVENQKTKLKLLRNRVTLGVLQDLEGVQAFKHRNSISKKLTPKSTVRDVATALQAVPLLRSIVQLEQLVYLILNESDSYLKFERPHTVNDLKKIEALTKDKIEGISSKSGSELSELMIALVSFSVEDKEVA